MRTARIVEEGAAYYHITSRVVDRRYVFDDAEKERVGGIRVKSPYSANGKADNK